MYISVDHSDALKEIFILNILPDRRLFLFKNQPCVNHSKRSKKHLLMWAFEDAIKLLFARYIIVLEVRLALFLIYTLNLSLIYSLYSTLNCFIH